MSKKLASKKLAYVSIVKHSKLSSMNIQIFFQEDGQNFNPLSTNLFKAKYNFEEGFIKR